MKIKKQSAATVPSKYSPAMIKKDFKRNWALYLIVLPVVAWYLIFCYVPMVGILMSFQDFNFNVKYNFIENIIRSKWVGLAQFKSLFNSIYFGRVLSNTLRISVASIVFCFPAPIILALLVNELRNEKFKRLTQTVSYMPHFISMVVICGMVKDFTSDTGVVSVFIAKVLGIQPTNMLLNPNLFLPIYIASDIWQETGWNMIIYIAALASIDPSLYEAAVVDGANKWRQVWHITLPGILPTIVIMLIMRMGQILNVSFEKVLLLYNDLTADKAEVISTFVYKRGLLNREWSFSVAVGLFNSIVNFVLLVIVNTICSKVTETSLW